MSRRVSRRQKTALSIIAGSAAVGVAAAVAWPFLKRLRATGTLTIPGDEIVMTQNAPSYNPNKQINEGALTFLTPEQRLALEWEGV